MGTLELTARVEVSHSPDALQVAALNREATAAKRAGDWARACALLAQAKAIEGEAYAQTRLAKFLQQAGPAGRGAGRNPVAD
jgi:hypothetical protein